MGKQNSIYNFTLCILSVFHIIRRLQVTNETWLQIVVMKEAQVEITEFQIYSSIKSSLVTADLRRAMIRGEGAAT